MAFPETGLLFYLTSNNSEASSSDKTFVVHFCLFLFSLSNLTIIERKYENRQFTLQKYINQSRRKHNLNKNKLEQLFSYLFHYFIYLLFLSLDVFVPAKSTPLLIFHFFLQFCNIRSLPYLAKTRMQSVSGSN